MLRLFHGQIEPERPFVANSNLKNLTSTPI
jgi:hypothetical protein